MSNDNIDAIKIRAINLVRMAEQCGVVLTITQHADKPLAMGNHYTVVETRKARELDPATLQLRNGNEQEPEICSRCNGSGEGMYDGTRCGSCRGKGVEQTDQEET